MARTRRVLEPLTDGPFSKLCIGQYRLEPTYQETTERFWIRRLITEVRPDGIHVRLAPIHRSFRHILAFPDATLTVEDMVAEGDRVPIRYTATGTHGGEFMGIEPTEDDAEIVGYEIDRLADGQVVESWGLFDAFGLMKQLGIVEQPSE